MRLADIGDQAVVGSAHLYELLYVVRVARTHLYHRYLRVWAYRQQRERHSYVVVEVAPGGDDPVFRAEHQGYQVLGGRLAVGAGEPQHRQGTAADMGTVMHRKRLKRRKSVIHPYEARIVGKVRAVHDRIRRSCLQRPEGIVVAVEVLSLEREEYLPAAYLPAVRRDTAAAFSIFSVKLLYLHFDRMLS